MANKIKRIVDFGATWCPGCRVLKENLKSYDNRIPVEYIDCDTDDDMASKYGVRNLPTLLFLDDKDEIVEKNVGVIPLKSIYEIIEKYDK